MTSPHKSLSIPGLEAVYDTLATAIDQAGADKAQLFLVKLALLNANALGVPAQFQQHVQIALKNLYGALARRFRGGRPQALRRRERTPARPTNPPLKWGFNNRIRPCPCANLR